MLHKTLIDELEKCGLLVDYCDVFISCLDSHSDGTHSLQRIHWFASDKMLNFSKSFLMKKHIYLLGGLRVSTLSRNVNFWVNKLFKNRKSEMFASYISVSVTFQPWCNETFQVWLKCAITCLVNSVQVYYWLSPPGLAWMYAQPSLNCAAAHHLAAF